MGINVSFPSKNGLLVNGGREKHDHIICLTHFKLKYSAIFIFGESKYIVTIKKRLILLLIIYFTSKKMKYIDTLRGKG